MGHAGGVSPVVWLSEVPPLRSPVLVAAFDGWFDVGGAATGAVEHLAAIDRVTGVARIDADPFFDFTQQRPLVRLEGDERVIEWPDAAVHAHAVPAGPRDLVSVTGPEPHLHWRLFVDCLVEVMDRTRTVMVVTLGAHPADVPHTRPLPVTGSATEPDLAAALGLDLPSYEGPTGVVGVFQARLARLGIPSASLRVAVPHYVTSDPSPKASMALLERLERVTGIDTGWAELADEADAWQRRVDAALADEPEVAAYVERLEAAADARAARDLPTPDDLAAEFERFLRRHAGDPSAPGGDGTDGTSSPPGEDGTDGPPPPGPT